MGPYRKLVLLTCLLCAVACAAQTELPRAPDRPHELSLPEYTAELDHLASLTGQLSKPQQVPDILNQIPVSWRVQTSGQAFEIPAQWLRNGLAAWQKKPDQAELDSIATQLRTLRSQALAFQAAPADVGQQRALMNRILAGSEFHQVHGPTWLDRLKQRAVQLLIRLLGRAFASSAIPTISNVLIYGLMVAALLVLAYWMYRTVREGAQLETLMRSPLPVSSKEWTVWMAEARAAAGRGNWRDAIHLAYWCGISFLEAGGAWRPDRARTPREYLRLLPPASQHLPALRDLTRNFERVWYGTHEANASAFDQSLAQLEKLGCPSN